MGSLAALIILIATETGIPPNFALAVAICESNLNPTVVSAKRWDGSVDRGIFQLNSYVYPNINWADPETNIRLGIKHLRWLMEMECHNTYWAVAVSYNAGHSYMLKKIPPPQSSIEFANKVMLVYGELQKGYFSPVIQYKRGKFF